MRRIAAPLLVLLMCAAPGAAPAGSETTVTFDGQRLFSVRDETFLTAGSVGV